MKKLLLCALALAAFSGCAAMDQLAGLGVVTEHASTFDGSTIIEVSPNSLYDPASKWGTPLQLGARWSSATPDAVALLLAYNSDVTNSNPAYLDLTGLDINIDGAMSSYPAGQPTTLSSRGYNTVSRTIYTSSQNVVVVPYSVLQRMVASKNCRIRIHTGNGYQDADFSADHIPGGKSTAIVSIRSFMTKVAAVRH